MDGLESKGVTARAGSIDRRDFPDSDEGEESLVRAGQGQEDRHAGLA